MIFSVRTGLCKLLTLKTNLGDLELKDLTFAPKLPSSAHWMLRPCSSSNRTTRTWTAQPCSKTFTSQTNTTASSKECPHWPVDSWTRSQLWRNKECFLVGSVASSAPRSEIVGKWRSRAIRKAVERCGQRELSALSYTRGIDQPQPRVARTEIKVRFKVELSHYFERSR